MNAKLILKWDISVFLVIKTLLCQIYYLIHGYYCRHRHIHTYSVRYSAEWVRLEILGQQLSLYMYTNTRSQKYRLHDIAVVTHVKMSIILLLSANLP